MKGLGVRLTVLVSSILFVFMLLAGFWLERQLTEAIHDQEVAQTELHAKTLLASLQTLMLNGQGTLAREWLDRMRGAEGIIDILVLRQDGREAFTDLNTVEAVNTFLNEPRFERQPVKPHRAVLPRQQVLEEALQGNVAFEMDVEDAITVLMPIPTATECLACHGYDPSPLRGVLMLSVSTEQRERRIAEMRAALWGISAMLIGVLCAALLIALRVSVLRPVEILRNAIIRVAKGDRKARLPVVWQDELGEVAKVFNSMLKALRITEQRIRSVTDNVVEAIITIDEEGNIESANPAALEIFGYELDELVGKNVTVLMPEPYRSMHDSYIENYLRTGKGEIIGKRGGTELVGMRKNGSVFPMEIGVNEMDLGDRRYFVGIARDITERKEQIKAIEHQALHDALTDLPNRTLLSDRLRQAVLRGQRGGEQFALLVMDLDRFKEINDTLGHHYGDLILQQVAFRLKEGLRESDTVARLGGDEFAVLLPMSDEAHAVQIAEKLLRALEVPFVLEGQSLHVGVSIGIALYPRHGEDEIALLRLADVAMYVAKRTTRGYAVYDPKKDEHNPRALALLGELRAAIDQDELALYYQPKIDMRTETVNGVEALIRWEHPEHGTMSPDDFMPLAEQTGLIRPITLWVLRSAVRQLSQWSQAGLDLEMAVNLSVRNLQDARFPERVAKVIQSLGGDPHRLWLEITETAIMLDPQRAREVLSELDSMNLRLAIDDFGTGYSSLAYLRRLPVREVKIDKSFIEAMMDNENDETIVRAIIDLGHNVGLNVVAEGVENARTYQRLRELGCDIAQGFYISAPLPAAELTRWFETSCWPLSRRAESRKL